MIFVPGGLFWMGANRSGTDCPNTKDTGASDDELPCHEVNVPGFLVDKFEVTVSDYNSYWKAKGSKICGDPGTEPTCQPSNVLSYCNWGEGWKEKHPVNCVTWFQMDGYCKWKCSGCRLCTESEWEKAARGKDGRLYPWGDDDPLTAQSELGGPAGNFADETAKKEHSEWKIISGYDDGYADTAPVGEFPKGASPYGVMDMAGNVWEWVLDCYHQKYDLGGGKKAPDDGSEWKGDGCTDGSGRVVRGGGFYDGSYVLRASFRYGGVPGLHYLVGARCCRSP
jgi:formylglycine-generating enzyme required for sulfatase activity